MNQQNYIKWLHEIADKMHEIGQPPTDAQSVGIAKILAQDLTTATSEVLSITQARNDLADRIEMRPDALHTSYAVPYRSPVKTEPAREHYATNEAYNKAYDRWSENQR